MYCAPIPDESGLWDGGITFGTCTGCAFGVDLPLRGGDILPGWCPRDEPGWNIPSVVGNGEAPINPPGDAGIEFKGLVDLGGGCGGGPLPAAEPGLMDDELGRPPDCALDSWEAVVIVECPLLRYVEEDGVCCWLGTWPGAKADPVCCNKILMLSTLPTLDSRSSALCSVTCFSSWINLKNVIEKQVHCICRVAYFYVSIQYFILLKHFFVIMYIWFIICLRKFFFLVNVIAVVEIMLNPDVRNAML